MRTYCIMKLYDWQKRFLEFVDQHENRIINLYGYPYGKTSMADYDTNERHKYYHYDEEKTPNLDDDLQNGKTVILITIEEIEDSPDNLLYFEVTRDDKPTPDVTHISQ